MPFFRRDNEVSIFYEIIDSSHRSSEVCVLLGGLTRDHSIWRKVIPLLKEKYKILLLDNRDAGQSTSINDQYKIADLADDVAALMLYLGLSNAHVVGHSMGGFMALHIAAKYPNLVKTLVLCSTAQKQVPAGIEYLKSRIRLIDSQPNKEATTASKEDVIAVLDKLYAEESLRSQSFVEEIICHETSNNHPQSASSFRRQAYACINHDATNLVGLINCPTLIITGEKDKYYTPELATELASKFQQSKAVIIPNTAHMVQIEQPEELVMAFNNFVYEMCHIKSLSVR